MKREISPAIAAGIVVAVLVAVFAFLWFRPSSSNGGIPESRLQAARQRLNAGLPRPGTPLSANRFTPPAGGAPQSAPGASTQTR